MKFGILRRRGLSASWPLTAGLGCAWRAVRVEHSDGGPGVVAETGVRALAGASMSGGGGLRTFGFVSAPGA